MESIPELLDLEDSVLIDAVYRRLEQIENPSEAANDWRLLNDFRSLIYGDGLWHAYGDFIWEQGEVDNFQRAARRLSIDSMITILEGRSNCFNQPYQTEAEILRLLSDAVFAQFVREHPSQFEDQPNEQ